MTVIKSPMAHKTFSQEQLSWENYNTIFCYKSENPTNIQGINKSLNFVLKNRLNLRKVYLGSNLLFLKKLTINFYFFENKFFKLF